MIFQPEKQQVSLDKGCLERQSELYDDVAQVSVGGYNVCYKINKKEILNNLSFVAKPGSLLSIIGPSGAGKSTLLECITGRCIIKHLTGDITFNGLAITKAIAQRSCVFIPCEQRMLPYLTVYETLMVAANLKLFHFTKKQRKYKVDKLISELGLETCKNTIIGSEWRKGVSTGERKRTQIAVELLGNPSVIVADEPTTGLDSGLAFEIFQIFRNLSNSGRTVILSIHQAPSQIWSMFDQLMILSSGQCLYFGEAAVANQYFSMHNLVCPKTYNPADFLLFIASRYQGHCNMRNQACIDEIDEKTYGTKQEQHQSADIPGINLNENLRYLYENSELHKQLTYDIDLLNCNKTPGDESKRFLPNKTKTVRQRINEIRVLSKRSFINSLRNPIVCCIILLVQILQGLILGGVFWQLTGATSHQKPIDIDSSTILDHSLTKLIISGIDGKQPLLEFLKNGVDQNKSQPLVTLFSDPYWVVNSFNILTCGLPTLTTFRKYNTYGVRPVDPPENEAKTVSDIGPSEGIGAFVGFAQVLDHLYLHEDWSDLKSYENNPTFWYLNLMQQHGKVFLSPWMKCAGYPVLDNSLNFFFGESRRLSSNDTSEASKDGRKASNNRRQLLSLNDIDISIGIKDVGGIYGTDLIQSWIQMSQILSNCSHSTCKWFKTVFENMSAAGKQSFNALLTTENIVSALFLFVANIGFSSYDALITFPQERLLYNQEVSNQLYSTSSYFFAKNISEIPFQFLPNFIMVSIFYFMVGLNISFSQYVIYCVICFGVTFAAYGFGYLVSATSPKLQISVLIAPFILVFWLTTAGFFIRDSQIPNWIYVLSVIGFYKWGFFSLILNQFPRNGHLGILSNQIPLLLAGVQYESLIFTILILYLIGFMYRFLAFFSLKYTNRGIYA